MDAQFACSDPARTAVDGHRERRGVKRVEPLREKGRNHATEHVARPGLGKLGAAFGDGAQFLGVASTVEPSALRRFGLVGSVFVSRRAADRRAAELNAAREGER